MDVCADAGPRRADSVEGGLEIVPLEMYDSARAKIEANLRWLFAKAYGEEHVPAELRDPFYTDQYGVEHIKPPVLCQLVSGELYCQVCGLLLEGEQAVALTSHQAVIQTLARRRIHVTEPDDTPVSHDDLSSTPIKMSSHIPMIDALMMAYVLKMMNVERVVASVRRFSSFPSSKDLPFNMEEAMIFWINKVILKTRELSEKEMKIKQPLMDSPCHQKSPSKWYWKLVPPDLMNALAHCMLEPVEFSRVVRYRREHLSGRCFPHLALMEDLMKDVCDGAALLTLVHFYCPEHMRLDDICLKDVLSLSDSVYNIHLLREFSKQFLNCCFYLQPEDLLYGPPVLKNNLMVFIAELFWWFEVVKPDFVKPRDLQEIKDGRACLQSKSSRPLLAMSNTTKRSFMTPSPSADSLSIAAAAHDGCLRAKGSPSRHRQQNPAALVEESSETRNRSNSLSRMDGLMLGAQWSERKQSVRPVSQLDMDWERVCGDDVSLTRSISKDSLASNVISMTPRHRVNGQSVPQTAHCDHKEEEDELLAVVKPVSSTRPRESFFLEPLQPAVLRKNKEKTGISKREECGEGRRGPHTSTGSSHSHAFSPVSNNSERDSSSRQPGGFFLHDEAEEGVWDDVASDSEFEEDDGSITPEQDISKLLLMHVERKIRAEEGEESAKLRDDGCVQEKEDKESESGRASPCPSVMSQASSTSTGRMTSFAERRRHRAGFPDSTASSQTTTPDGSESAHFLSDASPSATAARPALASELVHLHMQLEEKRRAIEMQKKKIETVAARQRLQLGKAAFLHIVKKGRSDTLPHPVKPAPVLAEEKALAKDDACVDLLKARSENADQNPGDDNRLGVAEVGGVCDEPDLSECSRSIELLNEAIGSIQQQMMQLSLQQDLLMKQTVQVSATVPHSNLEAPPEPQPENKSRLSVHFTETLSTATKRAPRLSSSRSPRTKPSDLKLNKDANSRPASKGSIPTSSDLRPASTARNSRVEDEGSGKEAARCSKGIARNTTFRLQDPKSPEPPQSELPMVDASPSLDSENILILEESRAKASLIEVDLSELADPESSAEPDGEQKSGLGFFFKDDQKAEDELAKKRAAFLLKQQRKAEEARVRKQQLEAESELKRDETRRKAEEERVRKEEEKARRELIKQEYLRRKQQELLEEQGVTKPRPRKRKPRPKSLHRGESACSTPLSLCSAPSGSSLSLASAATEGDSVASGGGSHRGESLDSFPILSRNSSRNMERDWDNGSTASSITSVAEYNGPKLFKEPSAKSNKAIIQNAIAHCCLAGKVNESQKNTVLEEIERSEANHLIILFRDGGCQYRALYSYCPDTELILKIRGTGPRSISRKMIDRLYKYSSDRKQFTIIPAKSVSVSVDALTIHSHLWQAKRPCTSKRK